MNKKALKVAFVAVLTMVSGVNVFNAQKSETLSDIALANVEALADAELDINPECKNGCLDNGNGCYCYHEYAKYREAPWP